MAPVDDRLMQAIDTTIEAVLRRTRHLSSDEQAAALATAMRELMAPPRRPEPRQWDSADISYEHQED